MLPYSDLSVYSRLTWGFRIKVDFSLVLLPLAFLRSLRETRWLSMLGPFREVCDTQIALTWFIFVNQEASLRFDLWRVWVDKQRVLKLGLKSQGFRYCLVPRYEGDMSEVSHSHGRRQDCSDYNCDATWMSLTCTIVCFEAQA